MPDSDADLPVDIDPQLWFVSKRCGRRDFLREQNVHTFSGRMSAFCPHVSEHADYAVSLKDLNDCSPETKIWSRGFIVGNEPAPPLDPTGNEADEDTLEYRWWARARSAYRESGEWPRDVPRR